jgi:short-subunit dehydrogenase
MEYAGKTALITGASSGIGLAYAHEFAKRGSNLILVARRLDLLEALAKEIGATSSVNVAVIAMDLATLGAGQQLFDEVQNRGLQVDFLINNAGFGTNARLAKEDRKQIQSEIVLNVATLVDLTAAYLPQLLQRNFGAIINIASTASFQPVPGMAVYAATKAFVRSFTSAVWGEVAGTDVRVLTVNPGATQTAFFDIAGAKPAGALAPVANVVTTTFKALDAKKSKPSVIDGSANRIMAAFSSRLPQTLVIKAAASMFLPKEAK